MFAVGDHFVYTTLPVILIISLTVLGVAGDKVKAAVILRNDHDKATF